jgi:hypothetical protein
MDLVSGRGFQRNCKGKIRVNWLSLESFRHNQHLLFLILPLSVLAIANALFEYSLEPSKGGLDCVKQLFPSGGIDPSKFSTVREIGVRFLWLASCIALTVTSLAAIAISWLTMFGCLPLGRCIVGTLLALAIAIGHLAHLSFVPTSLKCVNFDLTLAILRNSSRFSDAFLGQQVQPVAYVVVVVATVAAMFLLVAASSTINLPRVPSDTNAPRAGVHMARLRNVLYIGSVMLITGIINMGAWMRWPAALFLSGEASEINGMALGVTTFWGATFTLTAIAAYVPAAVYVRMKAVEDFHQVNPDKTPAEQETWLKEHNLTISPGSQVIPIAAMVGPIIASPLGALLSHLLKQVPE